MIKHSHLALFLLLQPGFLAQCPQPFCAHEQITQDCLGTVKRCLLSLTVLQTWFAPEPLVVSCYTPQSSHQLLHNSFRKCITVKTCLSSELLPLHHQLTKNLTWSKVQQEQQHPNTTQAEFWILQHLWSSILQWEANCSNFSGQQSLKTPYWPPAAADEWKRSSVFSVVSTAMVFQKFM